jgi:hypothetical protein
MTEQKTRKPTKTYKALVGMNYVSIKDGKERRVEKGDTFEDMPPTSVKHELAAENIEEVK